MIFREDNERSALSRDKVHAVRAGVFRLAEHRLDVRIAFDGYLVVVRVDPLQLKHVITRRYRRRAKPDLLEYLLMQSDVRNVGRHSDHKLVLRPISGSTKARGTSTYFSAADLDQHR